MSDPKKTPKTADEIDSSISQDEDDELHEIAERYQQTRSDLEGNNAEILQRLRESPSLLDDEAP